MFFVELFKLSFSFARRAFLWANSLEAFIWVHLWMAELTRNVFESSRLQAQFFGWQAGWKKLGSPAYLCVFASPVNINFTVYCCCLSQRNAPPSPFNIMTLSPLIAFWEAHVVLTLASWLHFPWRIMMVLSFLLELFGKAICLWAATLMEHRRKTSVDNEHETEGRNVLIISPLFIIIDHNGSVSHCEQET